MFYNSMLRRIVHNPSHKINFKEIEVNDNVTYNKGPVKILEQGVKKLRTKEIPIVKVQWKHHNECKASWELEYKMREKFSYLF